MNRPAMEALAAVAAMALLSACNATPGAVADKVGGDSLTLRLATIDDINNNGQSFGPEAFVAQLGEVSGGRLRVEVTKTYGDGAADAESRLIRAMAAGEVDGGWPSTRAFAGAGIDGLEAVEVPMALTSYDAERALVSGPVAQSLLEQLEGSDIVGLGLAVGPLRRPFATGTPLLAPEDWRAVRFRAYNSPVQADTIRALGGTPLNLGFGWIDELNAGNLDGAEFDIAQYAESGLFSTQAAFVTANVVLWPKVFVLSISERRYDSLTEQQREWVRQAATAAMHASVEAHYDESSLVAELCERGVRFAIATHNELAALRDAVSPVRDGLGGGEAADLLLAIEALAAEHPETEVPDIPTDCRVGTSGTGEEPSVPTETSDLPDGVYRVEIAPDEVEAAGLSNGPGWSGTWTLTVDAGTYVLTCRPLEAPGRDCGGVTYDGPLEAGDLHGTGDRVYFVFNAERMASVTGCKLPASTEQGHCFDAGLYSMRWSLDGDTLTFTDPGGVDAHDKTIEPWLKIG